jgi:hypothetical protein
MRFQSLNRARAVAYAGKWRRDVLGIILRVRRLEIVAADSLGRKEEVNVRWQCGADFVGALVAPRSV